ncbi:hypothetical protein [Paenibacillus whitsoniae]|uniref:Uncharacterized protein n=1 Tax=Paenibacillus whitsoniae TaxID=2496558 RepID=A0A3S0IB36_9BACL|nr:hypothetical protein [Paenibacillus whitsoniae]RTE09099.1 hypothetical protein EJQ19_14115 [Paenibacillus whitsoniae]
MAISNDLILEWIDRVASLQGIQMDPTALADDVLLMAFVYKKEEEFVLAMSQVVRAIGQLVVNKVEASQLERNYSGWDSYHFQSRRVQGQRADLRIVFQNTQSSPLKVKGFGNRHIPSDIYKRLGSR